MSDRTLALFAQLIQLRKQGSITATQFEHQLAELLSEVQSQPPVQGVESLLSITNPPKWSQMKTFWIETLRTALLTGVGLLATSLLLNPIQGAITKQTNASMSQAAVSLSEQDKDIRVKLVDEFLEKSYLYTAVMYEAQTHRSSKEKYTGSADEGYNDMKNRLRIYYSTNQAVMDSLTKSDALAKRIFILLDAGKPKSIWAAERNELKRLNNRIAVLCLQGVGVHLESPKQLAPPLSK